MADHWIPMADGFWNIRGSFKVAGILDVGTQMSLVRRKRGDFVLLDSYTLTGAIEAQVLDLTDHGRAVSAILNLHPFHTLHVNAVARQFPRAKLYGTRRHARRAPSLAWQPLHTEDPALHELFQEDLRFSVPRGVDFIPANESLHFASVLALHKSSKVLHVDDTLSWVQLPLLSSLGGLKFHPTLRFVLQKRPRAAAEFRAWTQDLLQLSERAAQLCTAHGRDLPELSGHTASGQPAVASLVRAAISAVEPLLTRHERRYG